MTEEHRITIRLSADVRAQLEARSSAERPLAAVIRDAIAAYLADDRQTFRQIDARIPTDSPADAITDIVALRASVDRLSVQMQHALTRLDMASASGRRSTDIRQTPQRNTADKPYLPVYKPDLHYLGKLCPKGHDWEGTGQTLRKRSNQSCMQCSVAWVREARRRRREQRG